MDDSDDNPSKHDSDFEKSDDENVSNVNAEDIELGACSSEDEIDDMTLFKSLKILRRVCVLYTFVMLFTYRISHRLYNSFSIKSR